MFYRNLINKYYPEINIEEGLVKKKTTFRVNNLKSDVEEIESFLQTNNIKYSKVDYFKDAFILEDETNLYKIKINEDTPILALTNIVYYNNNNKTLPLGMNLSCGILLDNSLIKLKEIKKDKFNIIAYENPEDEMSKILVKKINVIEYEIEK